jgi:septal ring factor EnvC (AmiA/AmiB activator)
MQNEAKMLQSKLAEYANTNANNSRRIEAIESLLNEIKAQKEIDRNTFKENAFQFATYYKDKLDLSVAVKRSRTVGTLDEFAIFVVVFYLMLMI